MACKLPTGLRYATMNLQAAARYAIDVQQLPIAPSDQLQTVLHDLTRALVEARKRLAENDGAIVVDD